MSQFIALTDTTRERLAAGLYAKYRLRSPGTLTWETEPEHFKDRFYAQADDTLEVLRQDTIDEQPALAAITDRLNTGSSYNVGTDIANIIAEHQGEARCDVEGPHGWVCDEPADHQPANLHAAQHGGTWKGGVRPTAL